MLPGEYNQKYKNMELELERYKNYIHVQNMEFKNKLQQKEQQNRKNMELLMSQKNQEIASQGYQMNSMTKKIEEKDLEIQQLANQSYDRETVEFLLREKDRKIEELEIKCGGQTSEIQYLENVLEKHRNIEHDLKTEKTQNEKQIAQIESERRKEKYSYDQELLRMSALQADIKKENDKLNVKIQTLETEKQRLVNAVKNKENQMNSMIKTIEGKDLEIQQLANQSRDREAVKLLLREKDRKIKELASFQDEMKKENIKLNDKIQILERIKQQLGNAVRNQEPDYSQLGRIHGLEEKNHKLEKELEQKKNELEKAKRQKPEGISSEQLIDRSSVNEIIDIVQRLRQSVETSPVFHDSKTAKRANWIELAEEKLKNIAAMVVENKEEANQQEQTCRLCEQDLRFPRCSKCNTVFHGECIYRVFVNRNAAECCYCTNMSSVELAREFVPVQRPENNIER